MFLLFTVPAPTSVTISSSPEKLIAFASVTLTCTVELHRSVDTSLSVVTEWSGPPGFVTTRTAQAVTGSTTTYTSTYVVISFGRNESGNYSCATNITSTSLFLIDSEEQVNTSRITIGKQCNVKLRLFIFSQILHHYGDYICHLDI